MSNKLFNVNELKNNFSIGNALKKINEFEDNSDLENNTDNLVKWKDYEHQVVIESDDFFYKVYESDPMNDTKFNSVIREKLASIYNSLGIYWSVVTFEQNNKVYDFEQREKLKVSDEHDGSVEEIFLSFSFLLDRLEADLEFDKILLQLKKNPAYKKVVKLKLLIMCDMNYLDYAVYDNQAILLDDADFFIALIDHNNNQVYVPAEEEMKIETSYGTFLFSNIATEIRHDSIETKRYIDRLKDRKFRAWHMNSIEPNVTQKPNNRSHAKNNAITPIQNNCAISKVSKPQLMQQS